VVTNPSTVVTNPPTTAPDAGPSVVATPTHPPVEEEPGPKTKRPLAKLPIKLGLPEVQRVVSRERGSVMSCFQDHRDELPSAKGQVTVQFSILSSGKVTGAATQGALSGTPVGRCLEQRVTRMKFPVHRDKQVTLALPFEYRVEH
jgi:serine/threonine-protein kinase